MKKFLSVLMAATMLVGVMALTGCGGEAESSIPPDDGKGGAAEFQAFAGDWQAEGSGEYDFLEVGDDGA